MSDVPDEDHYKAWRFVKQEIRQISKLLEYCRMRENDGFTLRIQSPDLGITFTKRKFHRTTEEEKREETASYNMVLLADGINGA